MKKYMNISNRFIQLQPLLSALLLIIAVGALNKAAGQVINEQVTVVAEYEPSIPDFNKININPAASETEVKMPEMIYSVKPSPMETKLQPEAISAVKLVGEPKKSLTRNYIRGGMGNYTTPYAELWANSLQSKSHQLGVHAKHLSSSGTIEDHLKSSNSVNLIQLHGRKFFDQHTLSAGLGFRRNVVHHYGFDPRMFETVFNEDDLKQRFNRLNASAAFNSNYTEDDKLNHSLAFSVASVSDKFETRETGISIRGAADRRFELFDLTDYQQLGLDVSVGFVNHKDTVVTQNSTLISVRPFIATEFNEYYFKAGIDFSFAGDSVSKAYLFPFAEARLKLIEDALGIYAGITGGVTRQGFDALSEINPFIQSVVPVRYTRERFVFYAGAAARAGKHVNVYASFRTGFVGDAVFFVNDFSQIPYNRFLPVYDDAGFVSGRLEAEYHTAERIKVKAYAAFEKWNPENELQAWHKPVATLGAEGYYNIGNKVIARATLTAKGRQYAMVQDDEKAVTAHQMKGYTDLSLGLEYRYTRQLSAFLNLNNILGVRAYQWYNYPGYRFNALAGVSFAF